MNGRSLMTVLVLAAAAALPEAAHADTILWSTGVPQRVKRYDSYVYLAFASGYERDGRPQRWAAAPLHIAADSTWTRLDTHYTLIGSPENVYYTIWQRNGLAAPSVPFASGSLGPPAAAQEDPRLTLPPDNPVFRQHALAQPVFLPAGDYYLTLYAGPGQGNYLGWYGAADGQRADFQQDFLWRSEILPEPGFGEFRDHYLFPDDKVDSKQFYDLSFTLYGTQVPEPASCMTLACLALALGIGWRVRRGRREDA